MKKRFPDGDGPDDLDVKGAVNEYLDAESERVLRANAEHRRLVSEARKAEMIFWIGIGVAALGAVAILWAIAEWIAR